MTDDTTSIESSSPSRAEATATAKKKRKSTYYARKEEASALQAELEALQQQMKTLDANPETEPSKAFVEAISVNVQLQFNVGMNNNAIAGVQGHLSAHQASDAPFPLETFIHLKKDMASRQRTVLSLRDEKLRGGLEYMIERTRSLDLRRGHRKLESAYTPKGNLAFSQFDVTVFPGVESVHQVYTSLMEFFQHQEISISEALGVISIRESDSCDEAPVLQCRLLTTLPNGLDVESNGAIFFGFDDGKAVLDAPYGVFVAESIAQDDLYPFQPEIRGCLRLTSIMLVTETPGAPRRPKSVDVTLVRATFTRLHFPCHIPRGEDMENAAHAFLSRYDSVMLQVLREKLGCFSRSDAPV
ncbi:hypothetical protein Poli38472_012372 [Pythium oligandrum]|uniref:Uncharacterized protein n=1 Tax=Pythium oligandrum TaxID=41045 RepID=A0A8K1CRB7_PYTOL|nr:hypothetical protein Poli38472_012372 [Pythium oligandrum]|eukprot:TMW67256.1 hypothetical protein Poli38472_012372 [Pythium oligandrum]